jgi:integrase
MKTKMGYSDRYVFHSIRKTLTTMLENAGVTENIAADIVGHEKPRITYGLYSGGASLDTKRKALQKISYKFD